MNRQLYRRESDARPSVDGHSLIEYRIIVTLTDRDIAGRVDFRIVQPCFPVRNARIESLKGRGCLRIRAINQLARRRVTIERVVGHIGERVRASRDRGDAINEG